MLATISWGPQALEVKPRLRALEALPFWGSATPRLGSGQQASYVEDMVRCIECDSTYKDPDGRLADYRCPKCKGQLQRVRSPSKRPVEKKSDEQAVGALLGAGIGAAMGGPPGALVGGLIGLLLTSSEKKS